MEQLFTFLFGGWSLLLQTLIVFMIIDYLTGVVVAGYLGKLSSKIGFKGIAKKVMILSLVAVAHLLDQILVGDGQLLRDAVIFFYIANETVSIVENVGKTSLPISNKLKNTINMLKGEK